VRPAASVLTPEWTVTAQRIEFAGNLDAQGNVYLLECNAACELVSRRPDGVERFRVHVASLRSLGDFSDFVLAGTLVVLADPDSDLVVAYDSADGHFVWQRNLRAELVATYVSPTCATPNVVSVQTWPLVSDGSGGLAAGVYVGAIPRPGCGSALFKDTWVVSLDTATGATRWKTSWRTEGSNDLSAAFDEAGQLFVASHRNTLATLFSFAPDGTWRWNFTYGNSSTSLTVAGVYEGALVLYDGSETVRILDTSAGVEKGSTSQGFTSWASLMGGQPLQSYSFTWPSHPGMNLVRGDLVTGAFTVQPCSTCRATPSRTWVRRCSPRAGP